MNSQQLQQLASETGFQLAGAAPALPLHPDAAYFQDWIHRGAAGKMAYLTDHRADIRTDPRRLLPSARSVICLGQIYSGPEALSTQYDSRELAWISRYAWGDDYHHRMRADLQRFASRLLALAGPLEYLICLDTAPILERSYARQAGLGWIGRNSCLIDERLGSWFFLGEILVSIDIERGSPPPDRCGSCTACIDACPTGAIVPVSPDRFTLDAQRCISYLTIELRGPIPEPLRPLMGRHVFGCDICQDVCPWNRKAPAGRDAAYAPRPGTLAPPLDALAEVTEARFREMFRGTPVTRARYRGFMRNVVVAMGNSGLSRFRPSLERLARHPDEVISSHAVWALDRLASLPEPAPARECRMNT